MSQPVLAKKSAVPESASQVISPAQLPSKKTLPPKLTPPPPPKPIPVPRPKIADASSAALSSSLGGIGAFDQMPAGTLSGAYMADKNWRRLEASALAASSSSEAMDMIEPPKTSQPSRTSHLMPTSTSLHPATVHQVLMQSKDPKAVWMSLKVPTGGGGQGDTLNLDLTKCSSSTIGQVVDLSRILGDSEIQLILTEASILLESCANVIQTAGGSQINARSVLWAMLHDILEHCNVPAGDLILGHYHHPLFHRPSAQEFPDIRPPWVQFMEENPDLSLTQNPQVLAYVGQMAAWTTSYVSTALENESQRVPIYKMIQQIMKENPFSDLRVG